MADKPRRLLAMGGLALIIAAAFWMALAGSGEREEVKGPWTQVSAGGMHTCALNREGRAACWAKAGAAPMLAPDGVFTQISSGGAHACGLDPAGEVTCWGRDFKGSTDPPGGAFAQVSAGWDYTCGVREGGAVACWGWDGEGQASPPAGKFSSVEAGYRYTCGLLVDRTMSCWGAYEEFHLIPTGRFTRVSVGRGHTCGLRPDGDIECFGSNPHGLGPGGRKPPTPKYGRNTPPQGKFRALSGGYIHTCGIREDGSTVCWGHNAVDQARSPALSFKKVSAGFFHSCGLLADGSLRCWGWKIPIRGIPGEARRLARVEPKLPKDQARRIDQHYCPYEGLGMLYLRQNRTGLLRDHLETLVNSEPGARNSKAALEEVMEEVLSHRQRRILQEHLLKGERGQAAVERMAKKLGVSKDRLYRMEVAAYLKVRNALAARKAAPPRAAPDAR